MSFEQQIASLVARHLSHPDPLTSMKPLTTALGCSVIERDNKVGIWFTISSPQPDAKYETLVCNTLLQALRFHMQELGASYTGLALLNGLVTKDRWRHCVTNADDAYALATLLVYCTESMFSTVTDSFLSILNGWLQPETPLTSYPGTFTLSERIFGSAWRHVVLENGNVLWNQIPDLILATRPPFLPGLVVVSDIAIELPLPALAPT